MQKTPAKCPRSCRGTRTPVLGQECWSASRTKPGERTPKGQRELRRRSRSCAGDSGDRNTFARLTVGRYRPQTTTKEDGRIVSHSGSSEAPAQRPDSRVEYADPHSQ